MPLTRRKFIIHSVATAAALALYKARNLAADAALPRADSSATSPKHAPMASGPFQPSWDSLKQYKCPEWFRDAKFGIWACMTAQGFPEQGEWYARRMYQQGTDHYNYHIAHYGHPSKVGFKELNHMWKLDQWDPERMMALYKKAGAKYFVSLANHHDNFDVYDSAYQPWNSLAVGPKKDIVGTWAKLARAAGLKFGVSNHAARTWSWFEPAQGSDSTGPLAGVPYDGTLTKADGAGTWWDGLDPEDLYAQHHKPMGDDFYFWSNRLGGDLPSKAYCDKFVDRTFDLVSKYHPDLLYFDDAVLPLYQLDPSIGLRIAAHHYNTSVATHGQLDAVLTGKGLNSDQQQCMMLDYERGQSDSISPFPWQTDTCIGDWDYRRSIYDNHTYKTPDQVIKSLIDIVSKNGNLLLNIPVRGNGELDPDEIDFLERMASWTSVNGEGIFGTRPWKIAGEGPVKGGGGSFNEGVRRYTSRDFRFTTKGTALYAYAYGWPDDGMLTVRVLAQDAPGIVGTVKGVSLLGSTETLGWSRTADGLVVTLPAQKPCEHAYCLKIVGLDLAASEPVSPAPLPPPAIRASADGMIALKAEDAETHGKLAFQPGAVANIGFWDSGTDYVTWRVHFDAPGVYTIAATCSAQNGATAFVVDAGAGSSYPVAVPVTTSWYSYEAVGGMTTVAVAAAGDATVTLKSADPAGWRAMNLAGVTLSPVGK